MSAQNGTVYRYVRVDADHDVSADVLELSLGDSAAWSSVGVTFIPTGSRTPALIAADAETPPPPNFIGHWWRVLTGPGTSLPLGAGMNTIRGRLTDTPELPHFAWSIWVGTDE